MDIKWEIGFEEVIGNQFYWRRSFKRKKKYWIGGK